MTNYRITEADPIGSGGQMLKVRANLAAIRLLKQLQAEDARPPRRSKNNWSSIPAGVTPLSPSTPNPKVNG